MGTTDFYTEHGLTVYVLCITGDASVTVLCVSSDYLNKILIETCVRLVVVVVVMQVLSAVFCQHDLCTQIIYWVIFCTCVVAPKRGSSCSVSAFHIFLDHIS